MKSQSDQMVGRPSKKPPSTESRMFAWVKSQLVTSLRRIRSPIRSVASKRQPTSSTLSISHSRIAAWLKSTPLIPACCIRMYPASRWTTSG